MTVITAHTNPTALTLTVVAEFDVGVERVWQLWEDPRRLERWWGPLERSEGRTRMTTVSTFESIKQLENMSAMGMEEGMREAMGQIDSLLAEEDGA